MLGSVTQALPALVGRVGGDVAVRRVVADSRDVTPGDLFVAIPGVSVDGHTFIASAVANGAIGVVGERTPQDLPGLPWGAFSYFRVADARVAWGWLCAALHDYPGRKLRLVGVTGTDGKTTTVSLVHAILRAAGLSAGMISTVSASIGQREVDTGLHTTTPDPPVIQEHLARMLKAGATHAVLEVTSHGLAQQRVAGCDFDVAVITNITHEHLDYHGSLAAYRQAKASLFEGLRSSYVKPGMPKVAVLNGQDDSYPYLHPIPADRRIVYYCADAPPAALPQSAETVVASDVRFGADATRLTIVAPGGQISISSKLVGAFNVSNILAAVSVGVAFGVAPAAIAEGVAAMRGVPGRMERIEMGQEFLAVVDFAHTPNALDRALVAARSMVAPGGRLIVVFGSAGLRDRQKRTLMGRVAGRRADLVVITAEDPRTESLDEIMAVSARAAEREGKSEGRDLWCVPDRGRAILFACQQAQSGDAVIVCGKGHEQSMCFGTVEYPWDDREAMRLALQGRSLDTLPTAAPAKGASD